MKTLQTSTKSNSLSPHQCCGAKTSTGAGKHPLVSHLTLALGTLALTCGLGLLCSSTSAAEPTSQEPVVKVKPFASQEAESPSAEANEVIDVLQIMGKAYARGDIKEYIKHLDDHCSVFDEEKNKMVEGKDAVIAALTQKFSKHPKAETEHIKSYTIDQPYVKVNGEMAVVTYRAIEEVSGPHEKTMQGFMSDVFKKEDGHWMKVHQRAVWKRIK